MAEQPDLSPCIALPIDPGEEILAVGWLERGSVFRTGPVPADVFSRLQFLCTQPWQPFVACGSHECRLCQFDGPSGSANVYIPGHQVIYVCPELILHYISCHWYLPPEQSITAVRQCPDPGTMNYKRLLLENGGRRLLTIMSLDH